MQYYCYFTKYRIERKKFLRDLEITKIVDA